MTEKLNDREISTSKSPAKSNYSKSTSVDGLCQAGDKLMIPVACQETISGSQHSYTLPSSP